MFETPRVKVIKEEPTDTSRFTAVADIKVVITPFFVFGIDILSEGCAGIMGDFVPMSRVFFETVIRREIKAAAEPPMWNRVYFLCDQETHIGM